MNECEQIVMNHLIDTWNSFLKLDTSYRDEQNDFRFHIHALQNLIMAREAHRNMKEGETQLNRRLNFQ